MGNIRNIIRPSNILTTPKLLQEVLGASRTRSWPREGEIRRNFYDFDRDLFLIYPPPSVVTTTNPERYADVHRFFSASKPVQRGLLEQCGVGVIPYITRKGDASALLSKRYVEENTFIVRPMRHSGGRDYKVTDSPTDFEEGKEYLSVLFPKRREYRVIFFKGSPIITLRKRTPDGLDRTAAWNHANGSVFVTVEHEINNHLLKTSVMDDLTNCPIVQNSHLIGVDILLDKGSKKYAVLEINACPALTLEHNLEKVKEIVSHMEQSGSTD